MQTWLVDGKVKGEMGRFREDRDLQDVINKVPYGLDDNIIHFQKLPCVLNRYLTILPDPKFSSSAFVSKLVCFS